MRRLEDGVVHGGRRLLKDWVGMRRELDVGPLGLEFGELSAVCDGGEGAPEKQSHQPQTDDGAYQAKHEGQRVRVVRADLRPLFAVFGQVQHDDSRGSPGSVIVAVGEDVVAASESEGAVLPLRGDVVRTAFGEREITHWTANIQAGIDRPVLCAVVLLAEGVALDARSERRGKIMWALSKAYSTLRLGFNGFFDTSRVRFSGRVGPKRVSAFPLILYPLL